jgi:alcohol dehydrogenase (cytochrome c)
LRLAYSIAWAKGITLTVRPILTDVAAVSSARRRTRPGINGGTNWQSRAFDPGRGFIFVPATESSSVFTKLLQDRVMAKRGGRFLGSGWSQIAAATNEILAVDATSRRQRWKYRAPSGHYSGLLATAGGLVFGASAGVSFALDADTGREVWRVPLSGNTKSSPISFTVDGRQGDCHSGWTGSIRVWAVDHDAHRILND